MENISELKRNAKASDLGDLNIFTSNLDSDIEGNLITAYDLKGEFLKVADRFSMKGQIFCQGSALPFNLPRALKKGHRDAF